MSAHHRTRSEREQVELFQALPDNLAPRNAQGRAMIGAFSKQRCSRRADAPRANLERKFADSGTPS
jgi:plasmid replication initiation protein